MADTTSVAEDKLERRVTDLLHECLHGSGYELVRVSLTGPGRRTLQVMVEREDRVPIAVDDCAAVSGNVSAALDALDPIAEPFVLEVSSPGLDRPLTAIEHFRRFRGLTARVELAEAIAGRKRFTGRLLAVEGTGEDAEVRLALGDSEVRVPYLKVRKAKLVMDDDLLAAAERWVAAGRSP